VRQLSFRQRDENASRELTARSSAVNGPETARTHYGRFIIRHRDPPEAEGRGVFRNGAVTSRLHAYDAGAMTEIDAPSESAGPPLIVREPVITYRRLIGRGRRGGGGASPDPEKKKGRSLHKEHCGQEATSPRRTQRRDLGFVDPTRRWKIGPTARTFDSSERLVLQMRLRLLSMRFPFNVGADQSVTREFLVASCERE